MRRGRVWYARLFRNGRDAWVSLRTSDHDVAKVRLRRILDGDEPVNPAVSVGQAVERWLQVGIATRRNEAGQKLARARAEKYLRPRLGMRPLSMVTAEDCRRFRLAVEETGVSPQTVHHVMADLRNFLNHCVESELLLRSPFPRRIMPRIPHRAPDRLSDEEIEALVGLPGALGRLIRFGLGSMCRWGELVRATTSDIEKGGVLIVVAPKTGKLRRIPLPGALVQELRGHVGKIVPYSAASRGSVTRDMRKASGVTRFCLKMLRSTGACLWLERGGSLSALQAILGHADITTTTRHYAALSEAAVRVEAARVYGASAGNP